MSRIERGRMGRLPWAATGTGRPILVIAGLTPATGVKGDTYVRTVLAPVAPMAATRRLYAVNRRRDLPADLSMSDLAAEHAAAITEFFGEPVDVVGVSTGGSIAQQLASERPDAVRRLVLVSTGARLGELAKREQADVAEALRAGRVRRASALLINDVAPWAGPVIRGLGWAAAGPILGRAPARADLLATLEAEDGFDLAGCAPIQAPTLVVGGGRDPFYSRALLQETADLIPDAELLVAPKRGHMGVTRDRDARARIAAFLSQP